MLSSFPVCLIVGTVLGFLSGLGVGGGSLLILWLTLVLNISPETSRIINLLFFLPASLVSSFFRWKQGTLPVQQLLPAIAVGCTGAFLCYRLSFLLDTTLLRKFFGGLLIFTGIRELMYRPGKQEK